MADDIEREDRDSRVEREQPRALVLRPGSLRLGDWTVECEIVNAPARKASLSTMT